MDRIKVGVKVRPLIAREKASNCSVHWQADGEQSITQVDPATGHPKGEPIVFDHVFGPDSSNTEVFEVLVKPIVESAVKGFNGTIFAYGQTASGKTYTMMGDQFEPGIIPQAVNLIFNSIESSHGREFLLRVCYMEIYNEKVHDLLCKSNRNLKISEDSSGNVFVKDLEETITSSSQMVMDLMKRGEQIRKIGVTNMNERSSRSHSIFRVIIESRAAGSETDEAIQVSHLNLVDLAGSERAGATGAVGDRFLEGCAINKSLFTLGKVISQLSEGQSSFVNFRDSKLTRILSSSLGGNALTAIVCAITPAALDETSSTLGFASRARNIQNTAKVNEVLTDRALMKRYIKQINLLKTEMSTLNEAKSAENQHLQNQNRLLLERLNRLKDALLVSNPDQDKSQEKLKKLRRRTWSAPNRNVSRLSLAFPLNKKTESISTLNDIREEDSRLSIKSDLDESMFATPLEEFEKALMKAESEKSIDWLPSADLLEDEVFQKSMETDVETTPALNYVQTRRNRGHLGRLEDFVPETPPSKLRATIRDKEKELEEIIEFTKLEKQMFDEALVEQNEALRSELRMLKNELQESRVECESLHDIKNHLENLKLSDKNSHDLQVLLLDTTKEVSKLNDEKKELTKKLTDAEAQCIDFNKMKNELDFTKKELSDHRKEKLQLKSSLAKQEEQMQLLQHEKYDFDFQFEIMKNNYEKRLKDLTQALEDARHETNTPQHVMRHNVNGGLYSLAEEPTIDDLVQQLEVLKEENQDLLHKVNDKDLLLNEISVKEDKIRNLEQELFELTKRISEITTNKDVISDEQCRPNEEIESLKNANDVLKQELANSEELLQLSSTELESLKDQLNNLKNDELLQQLDFLKEENQDLLLKVSDKDQLLNEMSLKEEKIRDLEKQLSDLSRSISEKTTTNDVHVDFSAQLVNLHEEIESLKNANDVLKEELANREELLQLSSTELESLKDQLNNLKNDELLQQLDSLKEENEDLLLKVSDKDQVLNEMSLKEDKIRDLEQQLSDLSRNISEETSDNDVHVDFSAQLVNLNGEIESLKNANDVLKEELASREELLQLSSTELESLKDQLNNLKNDELLQQLDSLKEENQDLLLKVSDKDQLLNEMSLKEEKIRDLEQQLSDLSRSISEKTTTNDVGVDQHIHCNEEIESLKNANNELKVELAKTEEELKLSSNELESLKIQVDNLRSDVSVSEPLHTVKLAIDDTSCPNCMGLEEEISRAKTLLFNSTDEMTCDESITLESLIQHFMVSLRDAREKYLVLEQRYEVCASNFTSNSDDLAMLQGKCSKLEEELKNIRGMFSEVQCLNDTESISLVSMVEKVVSVLQESEAGHVLLQETTTTSDSILNVKVDAATQCVEASNVGTAETSSLQAEIENLQKSNNTLLSDLDRKDKLVNETAVEMEHLREQIQNSLRNEELLQQLDSLKEENQDLLLKVSVKDQLLNEMSLKEEKIRDLEQQLSDLSRSISEKTTENNVHVDLSDQQIDFNEEIVSLKNANGLLKEELANREEVLKLSSSELESLKLQLNNLRNDSVAQRVKACDVEASCLVDERKNAEPECHRDEIITLRDANNSLVEKLKESEENISKSAFEIEQLQEKILLLETVTIPAGKIKEADCDIKSTLQMELENLEKSNKILLSDLDRKDKLVNEAAVEMENLREQIQNSLRNEELLQQLDSLKEENQDLLLQVSDRDQLLNEISLKEEKIRDLEQQLSDLPRSISEKTTENDCTDQHIHCNEEIESLKNAIIELKEELVKREEELNLSCNQLKSEKEALQVNLESKQAVIEESRQELEQVRKQAQDLLKTLQDTTEESSCQKCVVFSNELASSQQLLSRELKDVELSEKASIPDLTNRILFLFERANEECAELRQEVENEVRRRASAQQEVSALQKQCESLDNEICSAQKTLLAEVKTISNNGNIEELSLPSLVSEFLTSVMAAQQRVASILQLEIENCRNELEATAQRETECKSVIEELRCEVQQYRGKTENMEQAVEELKQKDCSTELEQLMHDLSEAREKYGSLCEENANLKSNIADVQSQVHSKEEEMAAQQQVVSTLQLEIENYRNELEATAQRETECKSVIEELRCEVKQYRSKTETLEQAVEELKQKDCSTELEQLMLDLSEAREKYGSLCEENANLKSSISDLQNQVDSKDKELEQAEAKLSGGSDLVDSLRKELSCQQEELSGLRQELKAQTKLVAGKDLLHSKVTSMYNELSEMKEQINVLKSDLSSKTTSLQEKEAKIISLQNCVEDLEKQKTILQSDLLKSKAERELALKNLALKSSVTPTEELQEVKVENEYLKQQHDDLLKGSRDIRSRNRKLQAEVNKLKDEVSKLKEEIVAVKPTNEQHASADLERQLQEEISKREELEKELDQICKLERSTKTSRVSDLRQKRASLDVKHSKEEIENLKSKEEKYKLELATKSLGLTDSKKVIKEKEELIAELAKQKEELNKECEELLSWGRSHEHNYNELIDRLADVLKDLAETKLRVIKVAIGNVNFVSGLCKGVLSSLDKITAERVEMQLSSKEKAMSNANGRVAEFSEKLEKSLKNVHALESLCSSLKKESDAVLGLDDESIAMWKKLECKANHPLKPCTECSLLSKWGKEQEAKAMELGNRVRDLSIQLEQEQNVKPLSTRSSRRRLVEPAEDDNSKPQCSNCLRLEEQIKTQKSEIADRKAEIVHLKLNQQLQNKPYEETIKRLENQFGRVKNENVALKAEVRRAQSHLETTIREPHRRLTKVNIATQTTETTSEIYKSQYWAGAPSGIVEEANKALLESRCKKLEQEKEAYKNLCVKRKQRIDELEQERNKYFNQENQENDEPNKSSYFTRSRKHN